MLIIEDSLKWILFLNIIIRKKRRREKELSKIIPLN
jgi:hypothetical protein